jgi:hypothetical protein
MKKSVVILLVLALVATSAFADVSWGAWCRTGLDLVSITGTNDPVMSVNPGWANGNRIGLSFSGTGKEFGFNVNVDTNGGNAVAVGDQAKLWWKPADFLKLEIGKIQVDNLRGSASSMNFSGAYGAGGEDEIFQRLYPKMGLAIELTPVEGLFAAYAIDATTTYPTLLANDLARSQFQVGYTIKDIAMIRAQYIGNVGDAQNFVQVAAKVLALGSMGITADVGAKIPLNNATTLATLNDPYLIEGYVHYSKDALTARIRAKAQIAAETGYYTNVGVYAMGMYKIIPLISAGIEGGFQSDTTSATATADPAFNVDPFIRFNAAGGTVTLAFEYYSDLNNTANNKIRIPVTFECGF